MGLINPGSHGDVEGGGYQSQCTAVEAGGQTTGQAIRPLGDPPCWAREGPDPTARSSRQGDPPRLIRALHVSPAPVETLLLPQRGRKHTHTARGGEEERTKASSVKPSPNSSSRFLPHFLSPPPDRNPRPRAIPDPPHPRRHGPPPPCPEQRLRPGRRRRPRRQRRW